MARAGWRRCGSTMSQVNDDAISTVEYLLLITHEIHEAIGISVSCKRLDKHSTGNSCLCPSQRKLPRNRFALKPAEKTPYFPAFRGWSTAPVFATIYNCLGSNSAAVPFALV